MKFIVKVNVVKFLSQMLKVLQMERDKIDAINLMVYGLNSVFMFIDLMTVTHPINLSHIYWTIGVGISYTLFTVGYFIGGGTTR